MFVNGDLKDFAHTIIMTVTVNSMLLFFDLFASVFAQVCCSFLQEG